MPELHLSIEDEQPELDAISSPLAPSYNFADLEGHKLLLSD
jgi:hypothetical protein